MRKFVNTSNYYISTLVDPIPIEGSDSAHTMVVADQAQDGNSLPTVGFYWLDVDFPDVNKREIFRIVSREGNTLVYDKRINNGNSNVSHASGAPVALRDFSQIFNMFSENIDNFGYVEHKDGLKVTIYGGEVFQFDATNNTIETQEMTIPANSTVYVYYDNLLNQFAYNDSQAALNSYYVLAEVKTNATSVIQISDLRPMVIPSSGGGGGGGGAGGGHTIKFTNQDCEATTLTQRPTMRFKRMKVDDDSVNLETVVEGIRQGTPDLIQSDEEIWVDENRQMVVEGTLTVEGTLHNYGKLFIL